MKNKYSVLMSVYYKENPKFFEVSLNSMINQTIKPGEIIIVEDGQLTKELYSVIKKFKTKYKDLITSLKLEENRGLGIALREGVKIAKYDIIARMDTDDISKLDRCEKQITFLNKNPNCSIVGGQIEEFISEPNNIVGKRIVPTNDLNIKKYLRKRCPFNHMTVMFRKKDVLDSGNYEDLLWNEDYLLWIKMAKQEKIFANLPDILVTVRVGKDMYQRRGGKKYFISEKRIQDILLKDGIITLPRYWINIIERLIIQILLPNKIRGYFFKRLARKK